MAVDDPNDEDAPVERAAERVDFHLAVTLRRLGYNPSSVELLNASTTGCKIETPERLVKGETVFLKFPGLDLIQARVAWAIDWTAGLEFMVPLHPAVFSMVVARVKR